WPRFASSISWRGRIKEGMRRRALHIVDRWLLTRNVQTVIAQSHTIAGRLGRELRINAAVLHPPAPLDGYRCDRYDNYILAISRLTPLKRLDLLIRALAEPVARHVKVVIAGDGESRQSLQVLAATIDVAERVRFVGQIDKRSLLTHLANCRAVCFVPFDEDYGL